MLVVGGGEGGRGEGEDSTLRLKYSPYGWGGQVVRRCWVNSQCRGILLIWIIVGQGPIALAVGVGGGYLDIFSLVYLFVAFSHFGRYRLKYCLKELLNPKQPTHPYQGHLIILIRDVTVYA